MSGVKIGTVTAIELDRKTYQAGRSSRGFGERADPGRHQRQDRQRIAARRHGGGARPGRRQDHAQGPAARSTTRRTPFPSPELLAKFMFSGTGSK
jgi:hypothetical protein